MNGLADMELLGIFEAQIDWVLLCFHRQFRDYDFDMHISTLTVNQEIIFPPNALRVPKR